MSSSHSPAPSLGPGDAAPHGSAVALLLCVFFASGFAALLYQVVWQRLLTLFSGADVFSSTLVVAAFMAGLGLGSLAGGYLADRLSPRACLLAFAAAEVAVGLFALVSITLYYDVLYARFGALDLSLPAIAVVLFLAVVWPTFFMGLSLPLLSRGLTPALPAAARVVGSLYGWNTLGAAVGSVITVWILLRRFDFATCVLLGAAVNFAIAAASVVASRRAAPGRGEAPSAAVPAGMPRPTTALRFSTWVALYALSGAVALSLEIAWFRVLGVMLKSTSFSFGTLLGFFLLGVGSGSVVGARWAARAPGAAAPRFFALQAAIPLCAVAGLALLVGAAAELPVLAPLRHYFAEPEPLRVGLAVAELRRDPLEVWTRTDPLAAEARLLLGLYVVLPLLLIGPPTFLMGLSFPWLQRAVQVDLGTLGRRVGWLQTGNIAGSLAGSLATGFVLLPWIGAPGTFRLLALAGAVFLLLWARLGGARRRRRFAVAALPVALALLVPGPGRFWAALHGTTPDVLVAEEGPTSVTAIRPSRDPAVDYLMSVGGLGVSAFPYGTYGGAHTVLGLLPVLLHPAPRAVAVIGLGSGDTAYAIAARPQTRRVTVIEIVGSQLEVLERFQRRRADPALGRLLAEPRVRFVVGDGRIWLRRSSLRWDVIEADALRPTSPQAGNLYSVEYFALLRERLRPGGLAVTWLPTPRVRNSLVRAFPHVAVFTGPALRIGVGSEAPVPFDRALVLERCADPALRAWFEPAGIDPCAVVRPLLAAPPERFGPGSDRSRFADVNSDLFPKDEFLVGAPW